MANVFGALNRFIARLDSEQPQKSSSFDAWGFQVLRNINAELAVEPWFDFVIGINGRTLDNSDPELFATEVKNCAGSTVNLGVWSAKGSQMREQYVHIPADTGSLGLSLQWTPLASTEDVWHILDVSPNSPADLAGLLPYSDYVIGSPEGPARGENGLPELIEAHMNRELRLYVYNHEYDVTRTITITPGRSWGGEGALGCVLGFGALHRVPAALTEPANAPGETLFESARFSNEELRAAPAVYQGAYQATPVPLVSTEPSTHTTIQTGTLGPPPIGPAKGVKKARAHHVVSPGAGIDDYFKEGEEKSRMVDKPSTPVNPAYLPPPPKGGPPRAVKSPVPAAEDEPAS